MSLSTRTKKQPSTEPRPRDVPLLFKSHAQMNMAAALRGDKKNVTRRLIQDHLGRMPLAPGSSVYHVWRDGELLQYVDAQITGVWRPPCLSGDRIWARETWYDLGWFENGMSTPSGFIHHEKPRWRPVRPPGWRPLFAADDPATLTQGPRTPADFPGYGVVGAMHGSTFDGAVQWRKRPSIFLPRDLARTVTPCVNVRPERLWDITEEDAIREGIRAWTKDGSLCKYWPCDPYDAVKKGPARCEWEHMPKTARAAFRALWDAINLRRAPWDSNPWVWRIEMAPYSEKQEPASESGQS